MFSSETETLKAREIAVDILSGPQTSVMAGKQGDIDGRGIDQRSPENTSSLLAPAKGGGTWTQKADMPTARYIAGSAVVDGKIYVIGGAPFKGGTTAAVEEYDPATDTWTRRADMPTARQSVAAAAVDGIIYAFGGVADINPATGMGRAVRTVEAYDPATDKWVKKTHQPTALDASPVVVVDGIIYVIGGRGPHNTILSVVEAYDPATDTWTRKADMPTARFRHAGCVIDGRIYVFGGIPTHPGSQTLTTAEVYDPTTDAWTQASDMPRARDNHTASAVAGKAYIIGGGDLSKPMDMNIEQAKIVDVYDPATDTWTTATDRPMGTGIAYHTVAVVDGRIYTIGGQGEPPHPVLSTVHEYAPGLPDNISVTSPAGKLLRTWGEVKSE
jgi:N-acetylneuraminic acid mutarotase